MPRALLVYPEIPISFWGVNFALPFIGKMSNMPPLGLLTVAALFPKGWELRVVDMNVKPLRDDDLQWADVVFTSTMIVQKTSLYDVIRRCNAIGVRVIAGGPHPTSYHEEIEVESGGNVSYFLSGEVEHIFEQFLRDLVAGTAQKVYVGPRDGKNVQTNVTTVPLPRYDLIDLTRYASMALQFSRGCPFDCEFCDITKLFGRVPRTKTVPQMLAEFQLLYDLGWRGSVFLVDDNFVGNKKAALQLLVALTAWQKKHRYPFRLFTEASLDIVKVRELLPAMRAANFTMVFLGIESPSKAALIATHKPQNIARDKGVDEQTHLLKVVRIIQSHGIEVTGGFIIGLDGDGVDEYGCPVGFNKHIEFIQAAGIPTAMAGLLTALKGTNLYDRLQGEGRLIKESSGNNLAATLNFVPQLTNEFLIAEYKRVLETLYDRTLANYFARCRTLLLHLTPTHRNVRSVGRTELLAFARSLGRQLAGSEKVEYARFLVWVLRNRSNMFPEAIRLAILGYHFREVTRLVCGGICHSE